MKLTKEFSDALGFKSLSNLTGFVTDYPVEGATIQKIVDDSFTATCFKCYPIIANAGVDPTTYVAKNQMLIRNELRKQFPVKVLVEKESDDETVEITPPKPDTNPFTGKRSVQYKPVNYNPAKATSPVSNTSTPPTELIIPAPKKCTCDGKVADLMHKTILDLNTQLGNEKRKNRTLQQDLTNAHAEIKALRNELANYKNDPEFQTILQYQKMKRQRKQ